MGNGKTQTLTTVHWERILEEFYQLHAGQQEIEKEKQHEKHYQTIMHTRIIKDYTASVKVITYPNRSKNSSGHCDPSCSVAKTAWTITASQEKSTPFHTWDMMTRTQARHPSTCAPIYKYTN